MPEPADQSPEAQKPSLALIPQAAPHDPPNPHSPRSPSGVRFLVRPFVQDKGVMQGRGKLSPARPDTRVPSPRGGARFTKLGPAPDRERVLQGQLTQLGWDGKLDVRCPRPHQPDLEGSSDPP